MVYSLALTACQFMEEPGTAVQVRESKHPYDNNTNFEVGKMPVWLLYQVHKHQGSIESQPLWWMLLPLLDSAIFVI